jgi:hypothetical protein
MGYNVQYKVINTGCFINYDDELLRTAEKLSIFYGKQNQSFNVRKILDI